jgi:hypothetical protein
MGIYICLLDGKSIVFLPDYSLKVEGGKLIYQIDLIYIPISLHYINIDWSFIPSHFPLTQMWIYLWRRVRARNG